MAVVAPDEVDDALTAMRAHPARYRRRRASARSWPSPKASSPCAPPSAAPASSTCSSATRCPGSAERARCPAPCCECTGTVQGVGFRPFVYRHAVALGLVGTVRNDSAGVLIDVEGDADLIATLERALTEEPPPLARVTSVGAPAGRLRRWPRHLPHRGDRRRWARCRPRSASTPARATSASPRSTIRRIAATATRSRTAPTAARATRSRRRVPYDRPATTMAGFAMCAGVPGRVRRSRRPPVPRPTECVPGRAGRRSPGATPTARRAPAGTTRSTPRSPRSRAARSSAVKGIGGYHLAVDAADERRGRASCAAARPATTSRSP